MVRRVLHDAIARLRCNSDATRKMAAEPRWRRVADALLLHVGVILAMYAGCLWVVSAVVWWDPVVFAALREVAPAQYRTARVALPAAAAAVLLVSHVAVATAHARGCTRTLMLVLLSVFSWSSLTSLVALTAVGAARVSRARVDEQTIADLRELRDRLRHLLHALGKYSELPEKFNHIIQDVEESVPWLCVGAAAAGGALLLALAALSAAAPAALYAHLTHYEPRPSSEALEEYREEEKKPLTPALSQPRLALPRGRRPKY